MKWLRRSWIPVLVILAFWMQGLGEIAIETEDGMLYGTLQASQDHPGQVIVLIAGSGPTDRNCNTPLVTGHTDSFLQLSQALNRQGYPVFRYDKRSAGKSLESFGRQAMVFDDYVKDAILVVEAMKDLGYDRVHLIGHSQGGLVALKTAQEIDVASVVHLSGPGRPIDQVFLQQLEILPKDLYVEARQALEKIRRGQEPDQVSEALQPYFSDEVIPFLANWMQFDPVAEAMAVSAPKLFIGGGADSQVPGADLKLFEDEVVDASFLLIPNMNHVLKGVESERENHRAYQDPSYGLDPALAESIISFLAQT